MSRIGKQPVVIPADVNVSVSGNTITMKSNKGELSYSYNPLVKVEQIETAQQARQEVETAHQANFSLRLPYQQPTIVWPDPQTFPSLPGLSQFHHTRHRKNKNGWVLNVARHSLGRQAQQILLEMEWDPFRIPMLINNEIFH